MPISVARLSYAACIDEVLLARLDADVFDSLLPDTLVANEHHRHVGMAEKTDGSALVGETCDSVEIAEDIAPLAGRIECRVHDREIMYSLL